MPTPVRLHRLPIAVGRRAVARSRTARNALFRVRWASTRRVAPVSSWGFDRGEPIDRWYISRFLSGHAAAVHGTALEVKEDLYASALGAHSVQVLDIDPANPLATVVGDLCDPATLPEGVYDVAIVTQTLQLVPDPQAALVHLRRSLRPEGVLLVTVPCLSRLAGEQDRWRWTPRGFEELVAAAELTGEVSGVGNVLSCRAFLFGAAVEDVDRAVLPHADPGCPLLVTAVLRRRGPDSLGSEGDDSAV